MKNTLLDGLVGCRIETHYGTGGVVTSYSGPYYTERWGKECWSICYRRYGEKKPTCFINSIKIENGVITCEGVPIKILDHVENTQMSLF